MLVTFVELVGCSAGKLKSARIEINGIGEATPAVQLNTVENGFTFDALTATIHPYK